MSKRTCARSALVLTIATAVLGTPIAAISQAADVQEVKQIQKSASRCRTDATCFEACKMALDKRDSTEFRELADQCNALYTAFVQRREQAFADSVDGSILKDGYSWMADVDAVVGSRPSGRQYPLTAEGRQDWNRNCSNPRFVRYLLDGQPPSELQVPGTKVRLKQVQYKKRSCIIGQIEVVGK